MGNETKRFLYNTMMHKEITRREEIAKIIDSYKKADPSATVSAENVTRIIRYSNCKYIFFLDIDNEYDWDINEDFWDKFTDDEKSERDAIISDIEQEQHIPAVKYLDKKSKMSYYCLLGESHYYAVTKNFDGAKKHLDYAKDYIENRKVEISRKWQLSYCLLILFAILVIQLIIDKNTAYFSSLFSIDPQTILNVKFLSVGVLGATLSVILKNGNQSYNCESGRWLNFLEVVSKMIAAGISCFIIILLFDLDLIFTALKDNHSDGVLFLLCIMAGFSERLIPSILQKIETEETQEDNKNNT